MLQNQQQNRDHHEKSNHFLYDPRPTLAQKFIKIGTRGRLSGPTDKIDWSKQNRTSFVASIGRSYVKSGKTSSDGKRNLMTFVDDAEGSLPDDAQQLKSILFNQWYRRHSFNVFLPLLLIKMMTKLVQNVLLIGSLSCRPNVQRPAVNCKIIKRITTRNICRPSADVLCGRLPKINK